MELLPLALLEPIEKPLTAILEWLHASVGLTWAWSIIALTLMVRIVILPLTVKQIRSMQKLQAHAPELKAIQQKYKGDKQRQQEEIMKFYRENKVNPAASCLPILIQIPIFISLFYTLKGFEKNVFPKYPDSDLGWLNVVPNITDSISSHWSGWLLLVVYVVSQVSSSYFMSATMDKNQRYLLMGLPIVFVFFIINFPIGLMLYWTTTNLWTVGQGLVTRRFAPRPKPPEKKSSRTPPKPQDDGNAGNGSTAPAPAPKPSPTATARSSGQPGQVRRRKKKGPQAGRKR